MSDDDVTNIPDSISTMLGSVMLDSITGQSVDELFMQETEELSRKSFSGHSSKTSVGQPLKL